eukprot:1930324-Rhodomonas_salina.1
MALLADAPRALAAGWQQHDAAVFSALVGEEEEVQVRRLRARRELARGRSSLKELTTTLVRGLEGAGGAGEGFEEDALSYSTRTQRERKREREGGWRAGQGGGSGGRRARGLCRAKRAPEAPGDAAAAHTNRVAPRPALRRCSLFAQDSMRLQAAPPAHLEPLPSHLHLCLSLSVSASVSVCVSGLRCGASPPHSTHSSPARMSRRIARHCAYSSAYMAFQRGCSQGPEAMSVERVPVVR